jgi:hypothetical protein
MKFKVHNISDSGTDEIWWLWEDDGETLRESEAFVFDSSKKNHMDNVKRDFLKDVHRVKLVI